jgi:hypothetical protein
LRTGRKGSLLDQIEDEALDGDVARALRLSLKLGGQAGSTDLREWASSELNGYSGTDLPPYRRITAPLMIDGANLAYMGSQQISMYHLPEGIRERFPKEIELSHSLPELIALTKGSKGSLRFAPPMSGELLLWMNSQAEYGTGIQSIYWQVHSSAIEGVVEVVRTRLIGLIAEIRAGLEPNEEIPSSELTEQAVNVVIRGRGNRVSVAQGAEQSDVVVDESRSGEQTSRGRKTFLTVVGLAGIAAAIFAGIQVWG